MGKYKGKKTKVRNNPLGIASVKEILIQAEQEDLISATTHDSSYISTLLDQIKSHCAEERDSGLNSLSVACQNEKSLATLLEKDVVKLVAPLMLDSSAMVRHSATGALRNISATGPLACEEMMRQDVLTPLFQLLKQKYSHSWTPAKKSADKIDSVTETFIEAMYLLWNLCEISDIALQRFNREELVHLLVGPFNSEIFSINVILAVALIDAMESMRPLLEKYLLEARQDDFRWQYLRVLVIGILHNIQRQDQPLPVDKQLYYFSTLAEIISKTVDLQAVVNMVDEREDVQDGKKDQRKANKSDNLNGGSEMETDAPEVLTLSPLDESANILSSQLLALTLLSNMIIQDDIEDNDEFQSEDSGSESFDGPVDDDMDFEDVAEAAIPAEMIQSENIPQKIINMTLTHQFMDPSKLTDSKARLVRLSWQLHSTALLTCQNFVSLLSIEQLGGVALLEELFSYLARQLEDVLRGSPVVHSNLMEASTSLLRAILQKWVESNVTRPVEWYNLKTLQLFDAIYKQTSDLKIRSNVIKIVGCYGLLLMKSDNASTSGDAVVTTLRQIGDFLVHSICDPFERDHLPVVAEALDTIFDVFAEDDHNQVLSELECITKLRKFQPIFKKYIHSQRRELGEYKAIIQTAKENLGRFIIYKAKMGCL